jgi:S-DNA-T family DNA segregation ATPase FtsK/SpoIIIE
MGNKRTDKQSKQNKAKNRKKLFSDERLRIILGVFIIFLSAFLTLAFISYLFTWKEDQSFQFSKVVSEADIRVENWSGKAGAHFANLFINKWFGIASFTFPFLFFVIGLRFFKIKIYSIQKSFKIAIIGTIITSVLLSYLFGNSNGYLGSGLGGSHGYIMAQWLNSFLGKAGTAFILLIAIISFVIFSSKKTYEWIIKIASGFFKKDYQEFIDQPETIQPTASRNAENTINESEPDQEEQEDDLIFMTRKIEEKAEIKAEPEVKKEDTDEEDIELTIEEKHKEEKLNGSVKNYSLEDYDPTLELSRFKLPSLDL